ncbi:MAG: hypothetical protein B7O98_07785 [Zestosphaera tikiterensis]|uniref:DUF401 family protein n=1 Tax=Zestosphaera tikiterensis TaxID=1973259 RepID=A0A2R7Y4U1_9CREN|nr:MAG: hypothetical protein B7O98_07785 [Zestosphaera tikiterensis]
MFVAEVIPLELVSVFVAVAVMFALVRLKVDLGLALVVEGLTIVLLSKYYLLPDVVLSTLKSDRSLSLILAALFISTLAELYRVSGLIKVFGDELVKFLRNPTLVLAFIPAVMGLMPIAGGAILSAPVVEVVGGSLGLSTASMAFLNVWFRHTIFFVYPLSQNLMAAAALTNHTLTELAAYQLPLTLAMFLLGYLHIRFRSGGTNLRNSSNGNIVFSKPDVRQLLLSSAPLLTSIAVALLIKPLLDVFKVYSDYSVPIGALVGVVVILVVNNGGGSRTRMLVKALKERRVASMVLASFGAMLTYYAIVLTGVPEVIASIIQEVKIPMLALELAIPGLLSLISGSSLVGITSSIPLLTLGRSISVSEASLMYFSAFMFYIASPVHLCLLFTNQYFKENLMRTYRYLIPATAVMTVIAVIYFVISSSFLGI